MTLVKLNGAGQDTSSVIIATDGSVLITGISTKNSGGITDSNF
jgi:hypothetical protein